jgi:hypothetical protein
MKREAVDMTSEAISRRLEQVRALYKLMLSLTRARVDLAKPIEPR